MISLQDIRQILSEIKGQIEQKVLHPYLLKYIQTPYIDEDKLLLFISLMDQLKIPSSKMKEYVYAAMLIQIALDTHEHVTTDPIEPDNNYEMTNRQLTVLAGDYYSGLYYKLLADIEDISMIKVLAKGIKEVNEYKIKYYQREFDRTDTLMACIKIIESSLFAKIADFFQINVWMEFIPELLLVKRLISEKHQLNLADTTPFFETLKKIIFPKNVGNYKDLSIEQQQYLQVICDRYIEFSISTIKSGISKVPQINDDVAERITSLLNQHQPIAKTFVEEG